MDFRNAVRKTDVYFYSGCVLYCSFFFFTFALALATAAALAALAVVGAYRDSLWSDRAISKPFVSQLSHQSSKADVASTDVAHAPKRPKCYPNKPQTAQFSSSLSCQKSIFLTIFIVLYKKKAHFSLPATYTRWLMALYMGIISTSSVETATKSALYFPNHNIPKKPKKNPKKPKKTKKKAKKTTENNRKQQTKALIIPSQSQSNQSASPVPTPLHH
jgi:hypothetical protein